MASISVGIIPAAGKAQRFNGYYKELLPVGDITILEMCVSILQTVCKEVVLVTNQEKIGEHARHLGSSVRYSIQKEDQDIWGAMKECYHYPADRYFFMMPDTVIPPYSFLRYYTSEFTLGTFITDTPERFGVIQDGRVHNKWKDADTPAQAWGVLVWTRKVVDLWKLHELNIKDYTDAINIAMSAYGFETFPLGYYYDMATFEDYARFIRERTSE